MHSVGNTMEKGRFNHQFKLLFFSNLLSYFIPLRKVGINDEQSGLMSSQQCSVQTFGVKLIMLVRITASPRFMPKAEH